MMAALHPAETALRHATTALNQAVAQSRTALVYYDTSKVEVVATLHWKSLSVCQ